MSSSKYIVNKTFFYSVILLPVFFVYAYLLIIPYTEGDQEYYRIFYNALSDTNITEVMPLALTKVASVEPVSIYVLLVGASLGIDKDIFISLLNIVLLLGLFLFCRKYEAGPIPTFLLLTNFYIIVLMTGAERLKIAYIILLWATFYTSNKARLLIGISGLAHLQNIIMFPSLLLANYSNSIRRIFKAGKFKKELFLATIILLIFSAILFGVFNETIFKKVIGAMSRVDSSIIQILNLVILTVVAIFATKNRWRMILLLLPMYPAVSILGGQRVNMIAVTLVIYFLATERMLNHPFVLFLLFYFSIKSIPFIYNILKYGTGFA